MITKKTKKSERSLDLKPLVYFLEVKEEQGQPVFYLRVSTGSVDNLKPELILSSIYESCDLSYDENAIQIHRIETYARNEDDSFVALSDMGSEIE